MSNYSSLKSAIDANIKANGRREITGPVLNAILNAVVNSLGDGYLFRGVAIPSTNPGTPDQNVAYLAITEGTYTHMGGLSVTDGELSVFSYNGAWSKIPLALVPTKTSQLDNDLRFVTSEEMGESLSLKQDTIQDLSEIRSGAALGATAYQKPSAGIPSSDMTDTVQQAISFAESTEKRSYNSSNPDGMGYLVLKKNKIFAEQVTEANTIYEIRYDFDLGGASVTIPEGCVLNFNGGRIANGTLIGNGFEVVADNTKQIFDAIIWGTAFITNEIIYTDWFDLVGDGVTDNYTMCKAFEVMIQNKGGGRIVFGQGKKYAALTPIQYQTNIYLNNRSASVFRFDNCVDLDIDLNGSTIQMLPSNTPMSNIFVFQNSKARIHNGIVLGDRIGHDYSAYTNWSGTSSTDFGWNCGIRQFGGELIAENLKVGQFTGAGFVLGSDVDSDMIKYHGQYQISNCEVYYCGGLAFACHSSVNTCTFRDIYIHHIGTFDSLPGNNPQAGIDFEFEDGIGDKPDIYINNSRFEECTRRAISVATSSAMRSFVCENSTFVMAALSIANLTTDGLNMMFNCYIEDSDNTQQTFLSHGFSSQMEVVSCKFVGLRALSVYPKAFINCSISTTSDTSKITNYTVFPMTSSAIFPVVRGCEFYVNVGWFQIFGQDHVVDTRFVFDQNINRVIMGKTTLTNCQLIAKVNTFERRSDNLSTTSDAVILNHCFINWPASGNNGVGGYSSSIPLYANECIFYDSPIVMRASYVHISNSYLELCRISTVTGGTAEESKFDNCTLRNCRGGGPKTTLFFDCKIENDLVESKECVLGFGSYVEANGTFRYIKCAITAKNFTSPTLASYGTFVDCYMDVSNGSLVGAKMCRCVVESNINNNAAVFEESLYYLNGVLTPAKSGATASRPSSSAVGAGFTYFDTDLGKMIVSNGTDWVNMDGSALS